MLPVPQGAVLRWVRSPCAGGTITGVQLAQSRTATAALQVEPATSSWSAYVLVRPHCEQSQ